MTDPTPARGRALTTGVGALVIFVGLMWLLEAIDLLVPGLDLDVHGIVPRALNGLDGIVWAPLLHGGLGHLISNTVPLLILGGLVLLGGRRRWVAVTVSVVLIGGGLTWLLARPDTIHIGASILVFGYAGFLVAIGVFERSVFGILVGIAVLVVFGGTLLWGILPISRGVSWEGHVFGLVAGMLVAFVAARSEDESRSPRG